MNKIRLIFKGASHLLQAEGLGLLILTDEEECKQLAIPCDISTLQQFEQRLVPKAGTRKRRIPELLWDIIHSYGENTYEILINDVNNGQYTAYFHDVENCNMQPMYAPEAILMAYTGGIPIYIKQELLERQGGEYRPGKTDVSVPINTLGIKMLHHAFDKAVEDENYELASYLRDELNRRKKQQG